MNISQLRLNYHARIAQNLLFVSGDEALGGIPNLANQQNKLSVALAWGIVNRIVQTPVHGDIPWQVATSRFEAVTCDFLQASSAYLNHLRPGDFQYECRNTAISRFVQYDHLLEIEEALEDNKALKAAFGGNYIVAPDIVISRMPIADDEINLTGILTDETGEHAKHTPLRASNQPVPRPFLHAVVSCKWTLRNDRAQNTKVEAANLIDNRKGNLPHIVAVTAEPLPSRIAALALGTGDLDCVYHFALNELMAAVLDSPYIDAADLLQMMVDGKRLRDISDLPFDLAA